VGGVLGHPSFEGIMQKLEMDFAGHVLEMVHDSPTIANGAVDIVQRLLGDINTVRSYDEIESIEVKPVVGLPGGWDFDVVGEFGSWNSRYLFADGRLVTAELSDFSLQAIEAIQKLRALCAELAIDHGLEKLEYLPA
jgi:hypothetical protein